MRDGRCRWEMIGARGLGEPPQGHAVCCSLLSMLNVVRTSSVRASSAPLRFPLPYHMEWMEDFAVSNWWETWGSWQEMGKICIRRYPCKIQTIPCLSQIVTASFVIFKVCDWLRHVPQAVLSMINSGM